MKSIAIEREFGSGGREIGILTAKLAGIPYYDGELLKKAARDQGVPVSMLEYYDEKRSGSLLYDLSSYVKQMQLHPGITVHQLFYGLQKTMRKLSKESPAVFIGRCATEILKEDPGALRVYIYSSSLDSRIRRTMDSEGCSEAAARQLIDKKDRQRRNYFKYWTQKDWDDRKNYDIELNTSVLTAEECANLLLSVCS